MIFDCGDTHDTYIGKIKEWHDFFPLWPRTVEIVEGRKICAWMQTIQRKAMKHYCWFDGCYTDWEYRRKP
jgi:hypothetical protein